MLSEKLRPGFKSDLCLMFNPDEYYRSEETSIKSSPKGTDQKYIFIRWLRGQIFAATSWLESLALLRKTYEKFRAHGCVSIQECHWSRAPDSIETGLTKAALPTSTP